MPSASGQPTTRLVAGGAPQAGQAPSATGFSAARVQLRGQRGEMHLQRRGDEGMLGDRIGRNGVAEDVRDHAGPGVAISRGEALERRPRRRRQVEGGCAGDERAQRALERGVAGEARPLERRHRVTGGARAGLRRRGRRGRQLGRDAGLELGDRRDEAEVGREVARLAELPEPRGAGGEEPGGLGQPHERRLRDSPDRGRVGLRRPGFGHSSPHEPHGPRGGRAGIRRASSPAWSRPAGSCRSRSRAASDGGAARPSRR